MSNFKEGQLVMVVLHEFSPFDNGYAHGTFQYDVDENTAYVQIDGMNYEFRQSAIFPADEQPAPAADSEQGELERLRAENAWLAQALDDEVAYRETVTDARNSYFEQLQAERAVHEQTRKLLAESMRTLNNLAARLSTDPEKPYPQPVSELLTSIRVFLSASAPVSSEPSADAEDFGTGDVVMVNGTHEYTVVEAYTDTDGTPLYYCKPNTAGVIADNFTASVLTLVRRAQQTSAPDSGSTLEAE